MSWSVAEYGATKEQVKKEEEDELRQKIAELRREQNKIAMDKLKANCTVQGTQLEGTSQYVRANLNANAYSINQVYAAQTATNVDKLT